MEAHNDHFRGMIPPPLVSLALLSLGLFAHWVLPVDFVIHDRSLRLFISAPMILLSGMVALTALKVMKENMTAVSYYQPTTRIVAKGPFRFTRNPLYLSLLLSFSGIAVYVNSVWLLALLVLLFVIFDHGIVVREERYLEARFGEDYTRYGDSVRRWL